MLQSRFEKAIALIDAANAADPTLVEINGQQCPLAVVHAERRTTWVKTLIGSAPSEALLLAAKGQHIKRWQIPRDRYPRNRVGYLQWRTDLKKFHADQTAQIMAEAGYALDQIERVKDLILKKQRKQDREAQALEDALCLVFLESQFSDFAQKEADKISSIIQKTWQKMSPQGQKLALQLPLKAEDRAIIEQALEQTHKEES